METGSVAATLLWETLGNKKVRKLCNNKINVSSVQCASPSSVSNQAEDVAEMVDPRKVIISCYTIDYIFFYKYTNIKYKIIPSNFITDHNFFSTNIHTLNAKLYQFHSSVKYTRSVCNTGPQLMMCKSVCVYGMCTCVCLEDTYWRFNFRNLTSWLTAHAAFLTIYLHLLMYIFLFRWVMYS